MRRIGRMNCSSTTTVWNFEYTPTFRNSTPDQLDKVFPIRRWNVKVETLSQMCVASGLNVRRSAQPSKSLWARICRNIKELA